MIIIFCITLLIVLLYILYPVFLFLYPSQNPLESPHQAGITGVTLILLTYNGKEYLSQKADDLLRELEVFSNHELIIIDDHSTDGSVEILNSYSNIPNVTLIIKESRKGIADSMNTGVQMARSGIIIFCDQRQHITMNSLKALVEPLRNEDVGMVSGYVSHLARNNSISLIRKHENFIKKCESRTGDLIGVYGPLYAIKRNCYPVLPAEIILDDLYLSLKVLAKMKVVLQQNSCIIDDDFSEIYRYPRTRSYFKGLMQLLGQTDLICKLSGKQKLMLFWHKYLRLMIPLLLFVSYIAIGLNMAHHKSLIIVFSICSAFLLIAVSLTLFNVRNKLINIVQLNMYYLFACIDVLATNLFYRRKSQVQ